MAGWLFLNTYFGTKITWISTKFASPLYYWSETIGNAGRNIVTPIKAQLSSVTGGKLRPRITFPDISISVAAATADFNSWVTSGFQLPRAGMHLKRWKVALLSASVDVHSFE